MAAGLNERQRAGVARICKEVGATRFLPERDEPHDAHVFIRFFAADGREVCERIIEGDGSTGEG